MSEAADDPGWVGCRKCGSLEYGTVTTYPCIEGVLRVHQCDVCGERFGSLATYYDAHSTRGHAAAKFTRLSGMILPVRSRP